MLEAKVVSLKDTLEKPLEVVWSRKGGSSCEA